MAVSNLLTWPPCLSALLKISLARAPRSKALCLASSRHHRTIGGALEVHSRRANSGVGKHDELRSTLGLFTKTVDQMSAKDSSNTHEVISEIFR